MQEESSFLRHKITWQETWDVEKTPPILEITYLVLMIDFLVKLGTLLLQSWGWGESYNPRPLPAETSLQQCPQPQS